MTANVPAMTLFDLEHPPPTPYIVCDSSEHDGEQPSLAATVLDWLTLLFHRKTLHARSG